jgi:hypothetical protein
LRFEAPRGGWHGLHTGGSEADTRVSVFASCDGRPVAEDDDGLGLQSQVVFEAAVGEERWLRVERVAADSGSLVVATVSPLGAGVLSGTVTEEPSGEPLRSVRVRIYRSSGSSSGLQYTDIQGMYTFSGLSADSYFVLTDGSPEHVDEIWDDHLCEPSCSVFSGDPVPVSDLEPGVADFALSRGGAISGQVVETGGGPITGPVRLFDAAGALVASVSSDSNGLYRFDGLVGGHYFVHTALSSHRNEVWDDHSCDPTCIPTNGNLVTVLDEQVTTGINFTLDRLGAIAGRLSDAQTGLPIAFKTIEIRRVDLTLLGTVSTAADGSWSFGGLAAGTYFVQSRLSSDYRNEVYDDVPCSPICITSLGMPVQVALNATTTGIDLALDRLGTISGATTDAGNGLPVPFFDVEIYRDSGSLAGTASSSTLGHYEEPSLQPGTYFVVTDEDGPYIDELYDDIPCHLGPTMGCDVVDGSPVVVPLATNVTDIDFALDLGGTVAGILTDGVTGEPILSQTVRLTSLVPFRVYSLQSNPLGRYVFPGLTAGTYFANTASTSHGNKIWDDIPCPPGCDPTTGTPIAVELGIDSTGVDFELDLLGGVAGSIRDEAGQPLSGVVIHVWNNAGVIVASAASDLQGVYQVDLSSGVFYLSTFNSLGLPEELWDDVPCPGGPASQGGCDPLTGDALTVVGADPVITGVDFVLGPTIFADGFESGDLSQWSNAVP